MPPEYPLMFPVIPADMTCATAAAVVYFFTAVATLWSFVISARM